MKIFWGGCCIPFLRAEANKDLRENFFTPQACAKAGDLSGGKLNGSTWTEVRKIYTGGVKHVRDCPIPSASTVSAAKKVVNETGKKLFHLRFFNRHLAREYALYRSHIQNSS